MEWNSALQNYFRDARHRTVRIGMDGQLTNLPAVKHERLIFKAFYVEMVAWPHSAMLEPLAAIVHHLGVTTMAGATRMKIVAAAIAVEIHDALQRLAATIMDGATLMKIVAAVIVVETLDALRLQTVTITHIVIGMKTVLVQTVVVTPIAALTAACVVIMSSTLG